MKGGLGPSLLPARSRRKDKRRPGGGHFGWRSRNAHAALASGVEPRGSGLARGSSERRSASVRFASRKVFIFLLALVVFGTFWGRRFAGGRRPPRNRRSGIVVERASGQVLIVETTGRTRLATVSGLGRSQPRVRGVFPRRPLRLCLRAGRRSQQDRSPAGRAGQAGGSGGQQHWRRHFPGWIAGGGFQLRARSA